MQPLKTKTKYERENYGFVVTIEAPVKSATKGAASYSLPVKLKTYPLISPAAVPDCPATVVTFIPFILPNNSKLSLLSFTII